MTENSQKSFLHDFIKISNKFQKFSLRNFPRIPQHIRIILIQSTRNYDRWFLRRHRCKNRVDNRIENKNKNIAWTRILQILFTCEFDHSLLLFICVLVEKNPWHDDIKNGNFSFGVHKIYLQEEMKEIKRQSTTERNSKRRESKKVLFYFCFFIASGHIKVVCMRDVREKEEEFRARLVTDKQRVIEWLHIMSASYNCYS